jgi:RNA polymerase sigma-70 factor (ECF subfamily)
MRTPPADAYVLPELLADHRARSAATTAGVQAEVTHLFEQLRNPLFRYLLSLGLSVQDGEEVIQESFLALFRHLRNGRPRDNLRAWIFRVGHNKALKVRHRQDPYPVLSLVGDVDGSPDPEQQALQNQRQQRLSAVIRALPKQDRACLSLRAEGIRYREIAEILGISLGAVALSLSRSLAKLARVQER